MEKLTDIEFYDFIVDEGNIIIQCHICHTPLQDLYICDRCEEYYCENCSYSYTLHYQFQGTRCYCCSGQDRINKLTNEDIQKNDSLVKQMIRENKLNEIINTGL